MRLERFRGSVMAMGVILAIAIAVAVLSWAGLI
jgi:hypothetical protein